jgi:5'-nucleotidase (lipoprotein e(P4) family)
MPRSILLSAACALLLAACVPIRYTHERLYGVLWMQTSAEYRALAAATFHQAYRTVEDLAKAERGGRKLPSAALEQPGYNTNHLPLAVIVDIDETILDNSRFQGELVKRHEAWDDRLWREWVQMRQAEFVAGAEQFVNKTRALGVTVFFVTNRRNTEELCTLEDLAPLVVPPDEFLAHGEKDPLTGETWDGEKQKRREAVARDYWILALVGDDLGDFIPGVRKTAPEQRVAAAETYIDRFGERWFLLPNPLYGSWESGLYDPSARDAKQLAERVGRVEGIGPEVDEDELTPCGVAPPPRPLVPKRSVTEESQEHF